MSKRRMLNRKQKIVLVLTLLSGALLAVLSLSASFVRSIPKSQLAAERWSETGGYAQVSVFYTEDAKADRTRFERFEETLEASYAEEGIKAEEGRELWISAASGEGTVFLESDRARMSVNAVGVIGEFFLFHPQKLLYGSLISGDSRRTDGIVIDEEIAWQLFGSSDVAGMEVMIGGVPHFISGVIERQCDAMEKKAGADEATVYLSYESLSTYGYTPGITCYEILLPNPVSGYGKTLVEKGLGAGGSRAELVENSGRYSVESLFRVVKAFGARSMKTTKMSYPTWENAARGWEDVLAVLLIWQSVCVAVLLLIGVALCVAGYRWIERAVRQWRRE